MTTYLLIKNLLNPLLIGDLYDLILLFNQPSGTETRSSMGIVMEELKFLGVTNGSDLINQVQHLKMCEACKNSFHKWRNRDPNDSCK